MDKIHESKSMRQCLAEIKQMQLYMPKSKKAFKYKYAPLEVIMPALLPILDDYGIDFQHTTDFNEKGEGYLKTVVFFIDDRATTSVEVVCRTIINPLASLKGMNEMMVIGAGTTYNRRYHLVTIFGLLTEDDTDAGGALAEDENGNVNGTNIKAPSVDDSQQEPDFVPTFKHQLTLGKTESAINKTFDMYKPKMEAKQIETITNMIKKHYENK